MVKEERTMGAAGFKIGLTGAKRAVQQMAA